MGHRQRPTLKTKLRAQTLLPWTDTPHYIRNFSFIVHETCDVNVDHDPAAYLYQSSRAPTRVIPKKNTGNKRMNPAVDLEST